MRKTLLLLTMLLFSSSAFATLDGGTAKIQKFLVYETGNIIYIYPEGGVKNAPDCHGSNGDYISYKMTRPMAKEYYSALLAAFSAGKTVEFRIENNCIDQSISATLSYFTIIN